MNRLHVSLAVAAVAAPLAWWWIGTSAPVDAAPVAPSRAEAAAPKPTAESTLELRRRALSDRWGDLFATPAKPPPPPPPKPVAEIPPAPKAPPLPYKYDGSGELQGKRFVYLA